VKEYKQAMSLRIFIDETARGDRQPLFEEIIYQARDAQLAGATVLRGPLGFGQSRVLHTAKILRLSYDMPVVIEIVDTDDKIQSFLPKLSVHENCVVTLTTVRAMQPTGKLTPASPKSGESASGVAEG
jgi:uncharacterized protein